MFPRTDVCAMEEAHPAERMDFSQTYQLLDNLELIGHLGGEQSGVIMGHGMALLKTGLELTAFNADDPAHLEKVGSLLIPGDLIFGDLTRNYALIYASERPRGLWRVDISDPSNMSAVQVYNPGDDEILSIRLADEEHTFVTTRHCDSFSPYFETCDEIFHIIDIANPEGPLTCIDGIPGKLKSRMAESSGPELIHPPTYDLDGGYSYAVAEDGRLELHEALDGDLHSYSFPYNLGNITIYGTNLYATARRYIEEQQTTEYVLLQIDITESWNPKYVGRLPYEPVLVGEWKNYAFLRAQFTNGGFPPGLEIMDMSAPTSVDVVKAPGSQILDMTFIEDRAYATTSTNLILIIDFSNLQAPTLLGSQSLGLQENYGISVADGFAYIIFRAETMLVMDVSDPTNITRVGTYKMTSIPVEVVAKDGFAFIAEWYGNLEIVDVSSPAEPRLVATYDAEDRIDKMHILGNYLFMNTSDALQVLDITDPTHPFQVGSFVTDGFISSLEIDCPYLYVSDVDNGLFVLRFDEILPTCPAEDPISSGP